MAFTEKRDIEGAMIAQFEKRSENKNVPGSFEGWFDMKLRVVS